MPTDPFDRRRQAARRLEPLPCGCRDPLACAHRREERLDDIALEAWRAAAQHLAYLGLPPLVPAVVRIAERQRCSRRRLLELASI
jgi:hypothetical protein